MLRVLARRDRQLLGIPAPLYSSRSRIWSFRKSILKETRGNCGPSLRFEESVERTVRWMNHEFTLRILVVSEGLARRFGQSQSISSLIVGLTAVGLEVRVATGITRVLIERLR